MTFMVKTLLQRCDKGIQVQFLKDRTELSISSMLQPSIRRHCRKIIYRFDGIDKDFLAEVNSILRRGPNGQ